MVAGTGNYTLDADVIDVLSVVVRRDGTDYALERLSRDEYLSIPNKTTQTPSEPILLRSTKTLRC